MIWRGIRYDKRQLDRLGDEDGAFGKLHVFDSAKDKRENGKDML